MNLRTTLLLFVLAAGGGALWYFHEPVARRLGFTPPPRSDASVPTFTALEKAFDPERIGRIEIHLPGQPVILERKGKSWSLPGGWPTRTPEVMQIVDLVSGLASRFEPVPIEGQTPDLSPYGLAAAQKPLRVDITVQQPASKDSTTYHLLFGEAQTGSNPFTRPTYLRLDNVPEVVRLPPGLLAVLRRPLASYQKRQLFPEIERVRFPDARPALDSDSPPPATALVDAAAIKIAAPGSSLAIKRVTPRVELPAKKPGGIELSGDRLATRWRLTEPVTDHVDPDKLKSVLSAIPELWAETFVSDADPKKTGLDKPERTLTVEFDDRAPVTIAIGNVSREVRRKGAEPPPSPFGAPPQPPQETVETYRYAKLSDNPQVFEVKADKLDSLFVTTTALRDAKPFRFRSGDAKRVEIVREGGKIVLAKEKDESAGGVERWKIVEPTKADADSAKVTELIDKISDLTVGAADIQDKYDAKALLLDPAVQGARIVLDVAEEVPGPNDTKEKKNRSLTLRLGKHDAAKAKVYVQAMGNPRVNVVSDDLLKLADRPALAYRGKRVLDVAASKVASIAVTRGAESFKLAQTDGKWSLVEPTKGEADATKANQLAGELSRLDAAEFVADDAKPDELAKYGLDKPALTAVLTFGDNLPTKTLQVGKARDGKPELYAKLADAPAVFAVRTALRDALDQPAVAYRPLTLWTEDPSKIDTASVTRGGDTYTLVLQDGKWKLSGPFDANAVPAAVQPLVNALASPKAERFETAATTDLAKYGLDKPALGVAIAAGKDEKSKHTLLIGKPSADGAATRFARREGDDAVFVVPATLVSAVDRAPLQLLDRKLVEVNPADIVTVKGTGPFGPWELAKVGDNWLVASLTPQAAVDRTAVDARLRVFAGMEASRLAGYGAKADLISSGLDKPEARVTVGTKDGKTHTLALGKKDGNDYYVRADDGPAVAVLPQAFAKELSRTSLDFVDRNLLAVNVADLTAIKRTGDGDFEFTRSPEGWTAVKPEGLKPDQPTLDELADAFARLRAVRIAGINAKDLKPFGLDKPSAVVTLVLKNGTKAVKIGSTTAADSEERFATVEGSNVIAVLPAGLSKRLVAEPLKFRDRAITRFADADRVVIQRSGRKVTFAKSDGTWRMTEPTTAEADNTDLDDLIGVLAKLRADELVVEKPDDLKKYGLDAPGVHWQIFSGDRDVLDLLIGKADGPDGRHYAKRSNGAGVFLLDKDLSAKLLTEYRRKALWANLDAASIETLVYNVGDKTLVLQKVGEAWQVPGKPEQGVNDKSVADLLAALATLKVDHYVADKGADFKLYGLASPLRTIVVRPRSGQPQTLYLGTFEDNSKRVYARLLDKDRTDVFVLSEADSAKLVKELRDFAK